MPVVIHRTLLNRVDTSDLDAYPPSDWLCDPDLSAVAGHPTRHWRIVDDQVVLKDEAGIAAADLAYLTTIKEMVMDQLWWQFHEYEFKRFSGGIFAQILELKMLGVTRAAMIQEWLQNLWLDYYTRKAQIGAATTVEAVMAVSQDPSNNGEPPATVAEMLQEAYVLTHPS